MGKHNGSCYPVVVLLVVVFCFGSDFHLDSNNHFGNSYHNAVHCNHGNNKHFVTFATLVTSFVSKIVATLIAVSVLISVVR